MEEFGYEKKTILVADDHWASCSGIALYCKEAIPDCNVIECQRIENVFNVLKEQAVDLLILDVYFGEENCFPQLIQIRHLYPNLKILLSSMSSEEIFGYRGLKEGVNGFISKESSSTDYKNAISTVLLGGLYLSKKLQEISAKALYQGKYTVGNPFDNLSEREFQICSYVLQGMNVVAISKMLGINSSTTSSYKARAFEKLGVTNEKEFFKLCELYKFNSHLK